MSNEIQKAVEQDIEQIHASQAKKIYEGLIQPDQYVGELFSINYETARVLIHDKERETVGGIPSLCFLIATRVNLSNEINFRDEDCSIVFLRVLDAASLPNSAEAERIRVETAQRVSGDLDKNWDGKGAMDGRTRAYLGYAGIKCRIIGTFFLENDEKNPEAPLKLKFGSDISNYYPNKGLKVFKPNGKALKKLVNFIDAKTLEDNFKKYGTNARVKLGNIRYASTNRKYQNIDTVAVGLYPADLLAQKSALFGMTRTGKSNTTKIIAKSIYELRCPLRKSDKPLRIGQLIFDPNGEYANENVQDNNSALKNIWRKVDKAKKREEVVTYGTTSHPNDPDRFLMLINFYNDNMLQTGKEIINSIIEKETSQYFRNFKDVRFEQPERESYEIEREFWSELTRYTRRVLVYRTLLHKAGFTISPNFTPRLSLGQNRPLFSRDVLNALASATHNDQRKQNLITRSAQILSTTAPSWSALEEAFQGLFYFLSTDAYGTFNNEYIKDSSSGESWADSDLERLLEMFAHSKGANLIGRASPYHAESSDTDFTDDIYHHLVNGKLVIIDQSTGEPDLNQDVADRIMWKIFRNNAALFRQRENPTDIIVYLEEAHNLLPPGSELDLKNVWVRTAKEGAKFRIGMVYATQEVSSIQKNILKNTANWFISHLNNTDETKELCKYYDFIDFEPSIRRAQDKGFLRVKTLSNPFIIPVQVDIFSVANS